MDSEEVDERITEVTVRANKKKQLAQYEPILEDVSLTAEVREGDDTDELLDALEDRAWEQVEEGVATRYEQNIRQEDD